MTNELKQNKMDELESLKEEIKKLKEQNERLSTDWHIINYFVVGEQWDYYAPITRKVLVKFKRVTDDCLVFEYKNDGDTELIDISFSHIRNWMIVNKPVDGTCSDNMLLERCVKDIINEEINYLIPRD